MASLEERFWVKVQKGSPEDCWLWTGARQSKGYGVMSIESRPRLAHRVAWETERGPIPDGMLVCHRCDTPPCVKLDHLFLGTPRANSQDMVAKGRSHGLLYDLRGEGNGNAKLTWNIVRDLRTRHAITPLCWAREARTLNVDPCGIRQAVLGKTWREFSRG